MIVGISGGIAVGGFLFEVDMSEAAKQMLKSDNDFGQCDCWNHRISVCNDLDEQTLSKVFIHECIEAVKHIYCDNKIEHEKIQQLSFGLHQVFESLGVRFGTTSPSPR